MNMHQPIETKVDTKKIAILLKDARQQLVETGTRNRLVHVNRDTTRANVVNIINERSNDVFDILKSKSRKMRFKATGKDKPNLDDDESKHDTPVLVEEPLLEEAFDESRYTDNLLETPLGSDAQQKRLLRLYREAKTAEEEQGINVLYLALGFLSWYEHKSSSVKREAPLILLPVELVRNAKTSTYDILCREDDIVTNMPLKERLRGDFGIELPDVETEKESWTPTRYFEKVSEIIESRPSWSIDDNGMQLGFFSFAKLLMLHDLEPENWRSGGLETKQLVAGLLASGFPHEEPLFGREDRLDEKLLPADIIQVVDADASQTKVIEEVRTGRNLVVQGPPGTGKSQTITNIIASAVYDGKKVLFVAEKMAALSVVHDRLVGAGLESICLELHSRAANKKQVLAELAKTLNAGVAVPELPDEPEQLTDIRNKLNAISALLHTEIESSDETPHSVIAELARLAGKNAPPAKIDGTVYAAMSHRQIKDLENLIDQYCRLLGDNTSSKENPFYGVQNINMQPMDVERVHSTVSKLVEQISGFEENATRAAELAHFNEPSLADLQAASKFYMLIANAPDQAANLVHLFNDETTLARLNNALQSAVDWQEVYERESAYFVDAAWSAPIDHLRAPIAVAVGGSMFSKMSGNYRSASGELGTLITSPLPKNPEERVAIFDRLFSAQKQKKLFDDNEPFLKEILGPHWQGETTPFAEILAVGTWKSSILELQPQASDETIVRGLEKKEIAEKTSSFLETNTSAILESASSVFEILDLSIADALYCDELANVRLVLLSNKLAAMDKAHDKYNDWVKLADTIKDVEAAELSEITDRIDNGELTAETAKDELLSARSEILWKKALDLEPELQTLRNYERHDLVRDFRELEQKRMQDVKAIIRSKHLAQLPQGAVGEMGIIRGEIGKKRSHKSVRKLMESAGETIQRIKPVMLMSPISVAQFLPPEVIDFDLLVIDEASQVRPEDALGAVARSAQIVVVGDQKQLPPTSFFDRVTGGLEDENEEYDVLGGMARATEMESILSLCEARSIPSRMLEWHYRSRDPSLIRVSNAEFYDQKLVLPPSPIENDDSYGLKFTKVDGIYSRRSGGEGSPATNKIEAEAVVAAIVEHASERPELSLGVVTFSMTQRNMVTELLEFERRHDKVLDRFLREGNTEDVFVKNIENVQGDERDVILVSIGYGPLSAGGQLHSMSFGPVNGEGGARRLNVLFSRARVKCEVFCSFEPGEINLEKTTKEGPRILKRYLDYAKTGEMEQATPTGEGADSPFEEDVANEIRKLGYEVDHQIGSAGFKIDLGVKHPNRDSQYMLAVECDGATYHSSLWARERDRLRQDVLENFGWHFHRIWSTDWFYRRPKELERLETVLKNATKVLENGISIKGANKRRDIEPVEEEAEKSEEPVAATDLPPAPVPDDEVAELEIETELESQEAETELEIKTAI